MKNKIRAYIEEHPSEAMVIGSTAATLLIGLITAVAKLIGSSAYAVHAAKRH